MANRRCLLIADNIHARSSLAKYTSGAATVIMAER